jgi:hypothetical protein
MTGADPRLHPRERAPISRLAFGLLAGPVGWALHLLVNTSIAGQYCAGASMTAEASASDATLSTIFLIDLIAIVLAIAGGYVAFEIWEKTAKGAQRHTDRITLAGEDRTRFLAFCGLLTSTLFGLALIFDAVGAMVGPPC